MALVLAAMAAVGVGIPSAGTVVPPTPEQILMMQKREALEYRARQSFGDFGLIEKLRDWRLTWGWILIGEEGSRKAPKLLIKDEHGWYEMRAGETRRLPVALGLEITRMLHDPDLWAEDAYNSAAKCEGRQRPFGIMHAGQDKFGRLGCGPQGLAARVARTAELGRALPGVATTIARPRQEEPPPPPGTSPEYYRASGQTSAHLFGMVAAWERKTLAGFVEPFAPDVILEGPFGTYQGRKMAVDWARHLQDWNAPYGEGDRKIRVERIVSKYQEAKDSFITAHEWRWEEAGRPVRQTFSTLWRNHDGQWLIAHQRMSEVKPVTDERVPW
jgi:hypothetical protein